MNLDSKSFLHLCRLSRLDPAPENRDGMAEQCSRILSYMDKLSEVDTTDVEPLYSPVLHESVFREDKAERRVQRQDILANAPQSDGSFFIVPRIVEAK